MSSQSTHQTFSTNFSSSQSSTPQDNAWLLDSGASHHVTSDVVDVPQSVPYNGSEGVTLGNGHILPIHCIRYGSLIHNNQKFFLALNHILRTPYTTHNLLYVHKLCYDNNIFMEFHENMFMSRILS